jgi:hypothetical protein
MQAQWVSADGQQTLQHRYDLNSGLPAGTAGG